MTFLTKYDIIIYVYIDDVVDFFVVFYDSIINHIVKKSYPEDIPYLSGIFTDKEVMNFMPDRKSFPKTSQWNIGIMMYYFFNGKREMFFDTFIFSDYTKYNSTYNSNKFGDCQNGTSAIPIDIIENLTAFMDTYPLLDNANKKKEQVIKLVKFATDEKITQVYKKTMCDDSNISSTDINTEVMLLKLILAAFKVDKSEQFTVSRNQEFKKNIDRLFSPLTTYEDFRDEIRKYAILESVPQVAGVTMVVPFNELDALTQGKKLSKDYFESISDRGRFKSYINTNGERIIIKNKLKTSRNSDEYDLSELVFGTVDNNQTINNSSISLHGVGGTGKTHQLLSLYDLIINGENNGFESSKLPKDLNLDTKIPFYLELNDVRSNTENCILVELSSRLNVKIDILVNILHEGGNDVILLLDGYNEVTNGSLREEIAKRICDIRRDYNTRVVITSRLDHSDMFNRINRGETAVFTQAEIQPLSSSQVNKYFKEIGVHRKFYKRMNKSEQRLVQTAQGLSMYGALLKKNSKKKIENLGTLLREYVNNIILEDAKNRNFEIYLEKIAYHMVLNGWFEITPENLKLLLADKYDEVTDDSFIQKLLVIDSKGNFEFTHQNIRDMYSALCFNNLIIDIDKNINYFTSNNITTNDEVLVLCGDLMKNDAVIQNSIEKLRNKQELDYSFILSVLIKIFAFRNKNDIHTLNLNGLDLSKVSLSGYILYHKEYQKNNETEKVTVKTAHVSIDNALISEDTFETNGLKRGSSMICKYSKDSSEYIVAFCSDNLVIYNTTTTKWKSIRYQFKDTKKKFGWINCAYHDASKQIIYLGTYNGYITFFSYSDEPFINTDSIAFLTYDKSCQHTNFKNGCSIESIIQVKMPNSSENVLIASTSAGAIFTLNLDENKIIVNPSEEEISAVRETFKTSYNEENFSVCKLTANTEYLFYSWKNKIYRRKLSNASWNFEEWISLEHRCIFDIYCTETYFFINTGKTILVASNTTGEILDNYTYSINHKNLTRQDKINRFTKISGFENRLDKVIVGISAEDQDRNTVPNYIVLTIEVGTNDEGDEENFINHYPVFGIEQTMTTFTAASFNQDGHTFIATTSNDRSVQILSVDIEDFKAIKHLGTYDGIHHIENISSRELLLAQYDGSISHWIFSDKNKEWRCMDVYPIHHDWVWKTRYYIDAEGNAFFFSCSYDGTVKRTNMKTYETDTLIEDDDKIVDLALVKEAEVLTKVIAVTTHSIISFDMSSKKKTEPKEFYDCDNFQETYPSYAIKSISPGIGEYSDTVLIAVNFYANNTQGLMNISRIYSLSGNNINLVNSAEQINLYDYTKIDELTNQNGHLIVTGNRTIDGITTEKIDVYTSTSIGQFDFSKIKSVPDLKDRRIVCISVYDNVVFIGCLDGSVFVLNLIDAADKSKLDNLIPSFLTHANLISIFPVKMVGVRWVDDSQKDNFKGYFKYI